MNEKLNKPIEQTLTYYSNDIAHILVNDQHTYLEYNLEKSNK